MSALRAQRERLEREVRTRKARLRSSALPASADTHEHSEDSSSPHEFVVKQIVSHPGASAAVVFGVMSVFGPWRSIRLASKAIGAVALVRRLTK